MRLHALAVCVLFVLACSGLMPKGPWHGEASFVAVLTGDAPTAEADAEVLAERLRFLGVTVEVTELSPTKLKLEVSEARSPEVIPLVLPRYLLEVTNPHGTLRNEDVEIATQQINEMMGHPYVQLVLTDEGAKTFCEMSEAGVKEKIDIIVDGKVLSSPIVQEAICGGRIQITMGHRDGEHDLDLARALATGLSSEPLGAVWTLDTIDLH